MVCSLSSFFFFHCPVIISEFSRLLKLKTIYRKWSRFSVFFFQWRDWKTFISPSERKNWRTLTGLFWVIMILRQYCWICFISKIICKLKTLYCVDWRSFTFLLFKPPLLESFFLRKLQWEELNVWTSPGHSIPNVNQHCHFALLHGYWLSLNYFRQKDIQEESIHC